MTVLQWHSCARLRLKRRPALRLKTERAHPKALGVLSKLTTGKKSLGQTLSTAPPDTLPQSTNGAQHAKDMATQTARRKFFPSYKKQVLASHPAMATRGWGKGMCPRYTHPKHRPERSQRRKFLAAGTELVCQRLGPSRAIQKAASHPETHGSHVRSALPWGGLMG